LTSFASQEQEHPGIVPHCQLGLVGFGGGCTLCSHGVRRSGRERRIPGRAAFCSGIQGFSWICVFLAPPAWMQLAWWQHGQEDPIPTNVLRVFPATDEL